MAIGQKALASQIIERARSLADLPNAAFISHTDELNSINESWKDLYSALTNSDDDYYLSESRLTVTAGMLVAGTVNEYLIPLPDDFYKIRYLDYQRDNQWYPVKKFPLSMKNYNPSEPYYRLKGSTLWLIVGGVNAAPITLKIGYYPPPPAITFPTIDLVYGTSYAPGNFPLVTSPVWATLNQTAVYVYNSIAITEESISAHTVGAPVTLYTAVTARTNLVYYKGYLYWIQAADIFRAPTNLVTTPIVPAAITATANVTSFAIFNDLIYYSPGATIKTCTLSGGSITALTAFAGSWLCVAGGILYYVSGTDLKSVTPAATVMSNVLACVTDGTYLYALDTSYNLYRLTMSTVPAVTVSSLLRADVSAIGPYYQGRIPMLLKEAQSFVAMATEIDYYFSFPSNLVPEIMAFSCARDYRAKGKMDVTELEKRLGGLWERFRSVIKRDEYSVERIRNTMDSGGRLW